MIVFPSGPPKSGSLGSGVFVNVGMGVKVKVEVRMAVEVDMDVGLDVGVVVEIDTEVDADVAVEVSADCGMGVEVEGGGKNAIAFVGVDVAATVFVGDAIVVGIVVCVVAIVPVIMGVVNDSPVANEAPGVRKTLIHAGFVRMAGSTGSINPLGLRVRKSLFGSSLDSILASSSQCEVKRSAHPPARSMNKSPIIRMRRMIAQSRLSCSSAFIGMSIDRQVNVNRGARIESFVMTGAFKPDLSLMCVHNAT